MCFVLCSRYSASDADLLKVFSLDRKGKENDGERDKTYEIIIIIHIYIFALLVCNARACLLKHLNIARALNVMHIYVHFSDGLVIVQFKFQIETLFALHVEMWVCTS